MNEPSSWSDVAAVSCTRHDRAASTLWQQLRTATGTFARLTAGQFARFDVVLEEARIARQIFEWVGCGSGFPRCGWPSGLKVRGHSHEKGQRELGPQNDPRHAAESCLNKGTAVYGRNQTGPRRRRLQPPRGQAEQPRRPYSNYPAESPGISIAVPVLVSEDLFAAVAEQLEENRKRQRQSNVEPVGSCKGFWSAEHCGYALNGSGDAPPVGERCLGCTFVLSVHRSQRESLRWAWPSATTPRFALTTWTRPSGRMSANSYENPRQASGGILAARLDGEPGPQPTLVEEQLGRRIKKVQLGAGPADRWISGGTPAEGGIRAPLGATRERLARLEAEAKDVAERRDEDRALRLALQGLEDFAESRVQAGAPTGASWQERREITVRGQASRGWEGRDPGGIPREPAPFC